MLQLESNPHHYYILEAHEDPEQALYLIIEQERKNHLIPFLQKENVLKYYKSKYYETPSETEINKVVLRVNRMMSTPFLYEHYRNFIESIKRCSGKFYFYDQLRNLIEKEMELAMRAK